MRPPDAVQPPSQLRAGCLAHRTPVAAAVAAVLAALASPLVRAADADIPALKEQVQSLQQQINDLEARQTKAALPPAGSAGGSSPSFNAGPVKVTLGGFVELMGISRSRNEAADWASNFNTGIPYPNSHNYDLSEFRLTERQSRISALAQGPADARFATEAYVETDFGGSTTNGNNNQSGSFAPRVRHFYADYQSLTHGWYLLFGQNWSLVTAEKTGMMPRQENIPLTIDGQYVPGFDWLRVSQVRLVKNFGHKLAVGLSAENPAAQVSAGTTAAAASNLNSNSYYNTAGASNAFASTTNLTTDYLPDVVAKVAFDPGWGHYEILGLSRWFRSRYTAIGAQTNRVTHGYGVGGSLLLPLVPKLLDFQASFLTGTGVGRYGSSGEPDVTINPANGTLAPLHGYHALGGLILHPGPTWTAFAYGGIEHVSARSYDVTTGTTTPVTAGSSPNTTSLYRMVQDDPMRVFVDVPQSVATDLMKVGVPARISAAGSPGPALTGTIARTSAAIDPKARTFRAELDIPNASRRLVPGQYVQVAFSLNDRGLKQVPAAALVFRSGEPEVAELASNGSVHFRPVTIARDDGDSVELSSGVSKGDRLVLNISSAITEGEEVRVSASEAAPPRTMAMRAP
ncbi:MAG: hypothetical protein JWM63_3147 [Gammaproteobacteria bacterium]|nr:hypothetical protein [Gammaproteobacteria bacterium]